MRVKKIYGVNNTTFETGRPMYMGMNPEAIHPYAKNLYRVIDCSIRYNKKYPYDNIALKVLLKDDVVKIISVRYCEDTIDIYKEIKNSLKLEIPVVVAFERLVALTYNFNVSSGIALHGVGLSVVNIENYSFTDKEWMEQKDYYTAPIKCVNTIGNISMYFHKENRYHQLPVVSIDEVSHLPIVMYKGQEWKTKYYDVVRGIAVCNLAICQSCLFRNRKKSCRYVGNDRDTYLALDEPILQ